MSGALARCPFPDEHSAATTADARREKLVARISALHSHDEPAILGWACDAAGPTTARRLGELVVIPDDPSGRGTEGEAS